MHAAELGALHVPTKNARQATILEAPPAAIVALHDAMESRDVGTPTAAIHHAGELVAVAEPRQRDVTLRLHRIGNDTRGASTSAPIRVNEQDVRRGDGT